VPKAILGRSVAAETHFEASANQSPVGFGEPPNRAYFTLQQRYYRKKDG
jgi:hypothetical protein